MLTFHIGYLLLSLFKAPSLVASQVQPPSPPKAYTEILGVTARSHVLVPRCGTTQSRVEWTFDGKTARLTKLKIHSRSVKAGDLAAINRQIARLADDVFIRVDCDGQAAVIALIQSQTAGTAAAKQVRYSVENHRINLEDKINLD